MAGLPWIVWSLVSVFIALVLSRRGIGFSATVLGVCLVLELRPRRGRDAPVQFTFGAYGRLLSSTVHPHDVDPAH